MVGFCIRSDYKFRLGIDTIFNCWCLIQYLRGEMMFLTSVLTGGQWFLPVIVVLVAAALLASYAKKKKLAKLEKVLNILGYVFMFLLMVILWIMYYRKEMAFSSAFIYTAIVIYTILSEILKKYKNTLKGKYQRAKMALAGIYAVAIGLMILVGGQFSSAAWLIAIIFIVVIWVIAYAIEKS